MKAGTKDRRAHDGEASGPTNQIVDKSKPILSVAVDVGEIIHGGVPYPNGKAL